MASREHTHATGAPSQRQLRVGEEIRHALSQTLRRGGLRDPALYDADLTISEVRISPDLKNATAFVIPFGETAQVQTAEIVAALNRAAGFLRGEVARTVRLKYAPSIRFVADGSFEEATKIESLLARERPTLDIEEEE